MIAHAVYALVNRALVAIIAIFVRSACRLTRTAFPIRIAVLTICAVHQITAHTLWAVGIFLTANKFASLLAIFKGLEEVGAIVPARTA
jgi:hypothetical protein